MSRFQLPVVPGLPDGVVVYDEAAVESLAANYLAGARADPPSWEHFLLGWAPARVFDGVLDRDSLAIPPPGFLHLLFESGYWGGAWLRRVLRAAQPDGMLANVAVKPDVAALEAAGAKARAALDAAAADDETVLEHAEGHLAEHVAGFGYNLGYLLEIVDFPPDGAPERATFVSEVSLLWADCEGDVLLSLAALRPVADQLEAPAIDVWEELADQVRPVRDEELARGREVWSTGLSAEGLGAEDYDRLLELSGGFLQVMQATALTTCDAIANRDAEAARRAALASAGIAPWTAAYAAGLVDPVRDGDATAEWPHFGSGA